MLRRSLKSSIAEGMLGEVFTAIANGAALTAWGLHVGLGPYGLALLATIPQATQMLQLPASWITSRFGARRSAIFTMSAARQIYWLLALLPWLRVSQATQQGVVMSVAGCSAILAVVGKNAWTTWMGELVPARVRGRYFGRRHALSALANVVAAVATGSALDVGARSAVTPSVLSALSAVAAITGAFTLTLLRRQSDVPHQGEVAPLGLRAKLHPLLDRSALRLVGYQILWQAASGFSTAFVAVYIVNTLKLGFAAVALYQGGAQAFRMVGGAHWGKRMDRVGARQVLIASSLGLAPMPLLWLLPPQWRVWTLAADVAFSGLLLAGQTLAVFSLPLEHARGPERPFYCGVVAAAGGFAFTGAAALAGALAHAFPRGLEMNRGTVLDAMQIPFALAALCRFGAFLLVYRDGKPRLRLQSFRLGRPWMPKRISARRVPVAALAQGSTPQHPWEPQRPAARQLPS